MTVLCSCCNATRGECLHNDVSAPAFDPLDMDVDARLVDALRTTEQAWRALCRSYPLVVAKVEGAVLASATSITCSTTEERAVRAALARWRSCTGRTATVDAIRLVVLGAVAELPVRRLISEAA